jgi:hypothetical protein
MAEATNTRKEMPRYRLTEKAYLNDRLYDPEEMPLDQMAEPDDTGTLPRKPLIVGFAGIPAYYMEPVNDAAKAAIAKHPERMRFSNPIDELVIVGDQPAKA